MNSYARRPDAAAATDGLPRSRHIVAEFCSRAEMTSKPLKMAIELLAFVFGTAVLIGFLWMVLGF